VNLKNSRLPTQDCLTLPKFEQAKLCYSNQANSQDQSPFGYDNSTTIAASEFFEGINRTPDKTTVIDSTHELKMVEASFVEKKDSSEATQAPCGPCPKHKEVQIEQTKR